MKIKQLIWSSQSIAKINNNIKLKIYRNHNLNKYELYIKLSHKDIYRISCQNDVAYLKKTAQSWYEDLIRSGVDEE